MRRQRGIVISLLVALAFGASIVSIEALPTCERLVKSFVEKRVRNRVSKTTAERWALWNKSHPDFKPKPRPKYKMTRKEVITKVELACETGPLPSVPPDSVEPPPDIAVLIAPPVAIPYIQPNLPDVTQVAMNGEPPLTFIPPYTTGITPPPVSSVPEPNGLVLSLTGASLVALFVLVARKRNEEVTA